MTNKEKLFLLIGELVEGQKSHTINILTFIFRNHDESNFVAFDETAINDDSVFVQLVESKSDFMLEEGSWEWASPGFCEVRLNSLHDSANQFISHEEASVPFQLTQEEKNELLSILEMMSL